MTRRRQGRTNPTRPTDPVVASLFARRMRAEVEEAGTIWRCLPVPLKVVGMAGAYRVASEIAGPAVLALLSGMT